MPCAETYYSLKKRATSLIPDPQVAMCNISTVYPAANSPKDNEKDEGLIGVLDLNMFKNKFF